MRQTAAIKVHAEFVTILLPDSPLNQFIEGLDAGFHGAPQEDGGTHH
jgi:hypothetical protein